MKQLISLFFKGLLYVVPVAVTLYVLVKAVSIADSLFSDVPVIQKIPGAGVIIIVILVTLVGYLGSRIITPSISSQFNKLMCSTPVIKMIYTSVRDLMKAFVGEKRKFSSPVIVSLDNSEINHRFGFVTQDDLSNLGVPGYVSVYVPCSYSFMGDLMIVPKDKVRPVNANSADIMKLIISGGVTATSEQDDNQE